MSPESNVHKLVTLKPRRLTMVPHPGEIHQLDYVLVTLKPTLSRGADVPGMKKTK